MGSKIRRRKLYEMLKNQKSLQVVEASKCLGVSTMTIRRDLIAMEKDELLSRSYGKAVLKDTGAFSGSFKDRENVNAQAKERVARAALPLLDGVNSIFLDGSTTCNTLAKILPTDRKLTVVTCNLNSLFYLREMPNVDIYVLGGLLAPDRNNMDGEYTYQMAKNLYVDVTFISCGGFSESGIVNSDLDGLQVCNILLGHAKTRVLLADSSKYQRRSLFDFSRWDRIDHFVTDHSIKPSLEEILHKNDVRLWIADC